MSARIIVCGVEIAEWLLGVCRRRNTPHTTSRHTSRRETPRTAPIVNEFLLALELPSASGCLPSVDMGTVDSGKVSSVALGSVATDRERCVLVVSAGMEPRNGVDEPRKTSEIGLLQTSSISRGHNFSLLYVKQKEHVVK